MVELSLDRRQVPGSNPCRPICALGGCSTMVSAPACRAGGCGFDSRHSRVVSFSNLFAGVWPSGKAPNFDFGMQRFDPSYPKFGDPISQLQIR